MKKHALVGFGKIGQALAAQMLEQGLELIALDSDPGIIISLEEGSYDTSEPGVRDTIIESFQAKKLLLTNDPQDLQGCRAVIVCIPLHVKDDDSGIVIDYEQFDQCIRSLAAIAENCTLFSFETTLPVGTCRNRIVSLFAAQAKHHGIDYLLAFSPERVMSNTMRKQLLTNPKLVGGLSEAALDAAIALYKSFLPEELVKPVPAIETAEMIKLSAMVARDLSIALVNQLSIYCDRAGLDFREVLSLVNTDEVSHLLNPGIGVGGHCTPVYPYFLIENFAEHDLDFSLAREARKINDSMPERLVGDICREFSVNNVLVLGLAFRPGVKEDRNSPTYRLKTILEAKGARVFLYDPLYSAEELLKKGFEPASAPGKEFDAGLKFEAIVLVTAAPQFASLDFKHLYSNGVKVIIDGRNFLDQNAILSAGIAYRGVGTGLYNSAMVLRS